MATFNTAAVGPAVRRSCAASSRGRPRRSWAGPRPPSRAAGSIPWDSDLADTGRSPTWNEWSGEGRRVMAAAVRDLDPAAFDPDGDLLAYVTDLQMTSLVGHGRPAPRRVQGGGGRRPGRPHPGPHGHRRRRHHRGGHRRAARHPRRGHARRRLRRPLRSRSGWPASTTSAWSDGSPPNTRCCWPTPSRRRVTWWP